MTQQRGWAWVVVVCLFCAANVRAQQPGAVPRLIKFSGAINSQISQTAQNGTGEAGQPTAVGVTFSLYELQEGGTPLWSEVQNVQVDEPGHYTVLLGATQPEGLPLDLFTSGKALWLGVQPQLPGAVEQPRVLLVAVPYALKAADADTLGGKPASAFVTAVSPSSSATGPTGSSKAGGGATQAAGGSGPSIGCSVASDGTATAGSLALFVSPCRIQKSFIFESGGSVQVGANLFARGSMTATSFRGDGTNVTNVNAAKLGGLLPSAFQPAGAYATLGANTFAATQTISSGDIALPSTTGSGVGVLTLGGSSFLHAYGGLSNTFVGSSAGNFTTTGTQNTSGGYQALYANTTGNQNTASGYQALSANTEGSDNTASGYFALSLNQTGNNNTASGASALFNNTTGTDNTALGHGSLYYNTLASFNTALGSYALANNSNSSGNTATGYLALQKNCYGISSGCTAVYNTALGYSAGVTSDGTSGNITGANNTFIGAYSGPGTSTNLNNATALGYNALVSASNSLVLGGTGPNAVNVGIGTPTPSQALEVVGNVKLTGSGHGLTFPDGTTQTTAGGGSGTVTSVGSGAGLTGGPITTNGTLSVATGGVTNAMLANPSLTVAAGTDLTGGGAVSLGGNVTLNLDTSKVPTLGTNYFTGIEFITGQLNASIAQGWAVVGWTTDSASGGVYGLDSATSGASSGVYGVAESGAGSGVYGINTATSGAAYGVYGTSASGIGVYGTGAAGVSGTSASSTGYGVYGSNSATTGNAIGVYGTSASSSGYGVYGYNSSTNGFALPVGVYGSASYQSDGVGVWGSSYNGVYGQGYFAVAGRASAENYATGVAGFGGAGTASWGVSGFPGTGTGSLAGYFGGNVTVTGTLTSGTKDFLIDHPLDAANKYLYHSSVESSEMMNIYRGNVVLDASGEAVVQLPDWFEALNTDFGYQLTAIGAPGPNLYIAQEVQGNSFKIAGGSPGMKVSWQVTGVRQDAYAKAHPLEVEVDKPEKERGYYIHPELFGQPEEKSIEWAHHPQQMRQLESGAKPPEPPGGGAR